MISQKNIFIILVTFIFSLNCDSFAQDSQTLSNPNSTISESINNTTIAELAVNATIPEIINNTKITAPVANTISDETINNTTIIESIANKTVSEIHNATNLKDSEKKENQENKSLEEAQNTENKKFSQEEQNTEILKLLNIVLKEQGMQKILLNNLRNQVSELIHKEAIFVGYLDLMLNHDGPMADIKKLEEFNTNPRISAIFVKLKHDLANYSSGSAESLTFALEEAKNKKPVIAYIQSSCPKNCYLIAIGASKIIATPMSMTGDFGEETVVEKRSNTQLDGNGIKANITYNVITAGKYKTITHPYTAPLKEEEINYLKEKNKEIDEYIFTRIAKARNLDLAQNKTWTDGQVFTGEAAKKLNLIDETGSFNDAKELIRKELLSKVSDSEENEKEKLFYKNVEIVLVDSKMQPIDFAQKSSNKREQEQD